MREWYEGSRLTDTQAAAWKWLAAQPGGPARILVLSEDWSSDWPARRAHAGARGRGHRHGAPHLDRDGQTFGKGSDPWLIPGAGRTPTSWREFVMNEKNGGAVAVHPGGGLLRQGSPPPLPLHRAPAIITRTAW